MMNKSMMERRRQASKVIHDTISGIGVPFDLKTVGSFGTGILSLVFKFKGFKIDYNEWELNSIGYDLECYTESQMVEKIKNMMRSKLERIIKIPEKLVVIKTESEFDELLDLLDEKDYLWASGHCIMQHFSAIARVTDEVNSGEQLVIFIDRKNKTITFANLNWVNDSNEFKNEKQYSLEEIKKEGF